MRDAPAGKGVAIPKGWNGIAFFGRLVNAGVCTYSELRFPGLTARDVFDMHRMLDFKEYCQAKAVEAPEPKNARRLLFDDERVENEP